MEKHATIPSYPGEITPAGKLRRNSPTSEYENDSLGPEGSYYDHLEREKADEKRRKDEASFPLIIAITYLVMGAVFDMWHPSWLLFFTIPLRYMKFRSTREMILNPVSATLIYLVIGFFFHIWHPTWLIFAFIPFAYIGGK